MAVAWGSAGLQTAADVRLTGTGPPAVAEFINQCARTLRMPPTAHARRRLLLGHTEDGRELSLAVRGRNVLVSGDPKSGKSWVAGLLCEQLILQGYSVCVIDPEGDYRGLEALPGVAVLGGDDPPPTPRALLQALRYPDRSVVIDLSQRTHDEKIQYIRALLPALNVLRQKPGLPHRILLDEAHYFLHGSDADQLLDFRANGYTIVTYCASRLPSELLASTEVMIVTCESNPVEVAALCRCCANCGPAAGAQWSLIEQLRPGQALVLPITEEAGGQLRLFTIAPRLTPHVRHRAKYVDVPVMDRHAFIFPRDGHGKSERIRTLRQLVERLETTAPQLLEPYLRRGDFSRWIADVFGDRTLAARLRALESGHRVRPRTDTFSELAGAIRGRYDLVDDELIALSAPDVAAATASAGRASLP